MGPGHKHHAPGAEGVLVRALPFPCVWGTGEVHHEGSVVVPYVFCGDVPPGCVWLWGMGKHVWAEGADGAPVETQ